MSLNLVYFGNSCITNLTTATPLNAAENKIPNVSNLV